MPNPGFSGRIGEAGAGPNAGLDSVVGRGGADASLYGRDKLRVLYVGATAREWVLLHGFAKRTSKTPEQDMKIAEARMTDYLEQRKRVEP